LSKPFIISSPNEASFSTNCTTQYVNYKNKENIEINKKKIFDLLVDEINLMNELCVMVKGLVEEILYVLLLMVQQNH
jgi:hypothetical protein